MAKELEADDIELKEYSFTPSEIEVSGRKVIDYTAIEHDKVFLVNKKDILNKKRPAWIPELDETDLTGNDFLPPCVKDKSAGNYYVLNNNTVYKMSLDLLSVTIDYYLKKKREQIKADGRNEKVTLPRGLKSMPTRRYNQIASLLPLCECYKADFEKYALDAVNLKRGSAAYRRQNIIIFHEQYHPLLEAVKGKRLDLNYSKQDYIDSYSKGEETSYGDSGCFNSLYGDYGIKIKKQNGSTFSKEQVEKMENAVEKVWKHYGNLKELSGEYGLKISYADNCMQHARQKAIGLFTPYYNAIGVSFFDDEKQKKIGLEHSADMTLSHEVAHWLDAQKGKELHHFFASDKDGTLENRIATLFKEEVRKRDGDSKKATRIGKSDHVALGEYWFRTCECFARAMEQSYALEQGIDLSQEKTYASKSVFEKEIKPLVDELMAENAKKFGLERSNKLNTKEDKQMNEEKTEITNSIAENEQAVKDSKFLMESYGDKKAVDAACKKASIADFVSTDETRYFMNGIFYENGFAIATNGKILIKQKKDYPAEWEGKIIHPQTGKEIDGQFPAYKNLFLNRENLVDRSSRLARISNYLSMATLGVALSQKSKYKFRNHNTPVVFENTLVNSSHLQLALAFARDKGFNKVYQEDNYEFKTEAVLDEDGNEIYKYYNMDEKSGSDLNHKYYSYDELPDNVKNAAETVEADNCTHILGNVDGVDWFYGKVEKTVKEYDRDPEKLLTRMIEFSAPDGSSILIMPIKESEEPFIDKDGILRNYEENNFIKTKLLGKEDDFYKNIVRTLLKTSDFADADVDGIYKANYEEALKKQNPDIFPKNKKDCQILAMTMTYTDAIGKNLDKTDFVFAKGQSTATFQQFVCNMWIEQFKDYAAHPERLFLSAEKLNPKNIIDMAKENDLIKEKDFNQELFAEEIKSEKEQMEYSFIVKDSAEFEQFEEFEPITGLTALDAVSQFKRLRDEGKTPGITLSIPGDFIFGEGTEQGASILETDPDGKASFSYGIGDSFITQLKEGDERSQVYIDAYKELYETLQKQNIPVVEPKFLFEKEKELFPERSVNNIKAIYVKEQAVEKEQIQSVFVADDLPVTFLLYGNTPDKKISELKEHLSLNGYTAEWNDNEKEFKVSYDDASYVKTMLEEREIEWNDRMGLISYGYDGKWVTDPMNVEIVSEEEFRRIQEIREKEFKETRTPYIKIADNNERSFDKYLMGGTVLSFAEADEILPDLNEKWGEGYYKTDFTMYMPDKDKQGRAVWSTYSPYRYEMGNAKSLGTLSDNLHRFCSVPEVLELFEESWKKIYAPSVTEEQEKAVSEILKPVKDLLETSYKQRFGELSAVLQNYKKNTSSFIVAVETVENAESDVKAVQDEIKNIFTSSIDMAAKNTSDYIEKLKDSLNDVEYAELERYISHQIVNMAEDAKYGESRTKGYPGSGFDFETWRKALEPLGEDAHLSITIKEIKEQYVEKVAMVKEAENMEQSKTEKIALTAEQWRACDELATAAKMDWWFEKYGADGNIHGPVLKDDLSDLSAAFDGQLRISKDNEIITRELFNNKGIKFDENYLLSAQEANAKAENLYGFYFEQSDFGTDIYRSEDGEWVGTSGEGGFGYADSLDGSNVSKIPNEIFRDVIALAEQFRYECEKENSMETKKELQQEENIIDKGIEQVYANGGMSELAMEADIKAQEVSYSDDIDEDVELVDTFRINGKDYLTSEVENLLKEDIVAIFQELDSGEVEQNLTLNGVKIYGAPEKDGKIKLLVEFDSKSSENKWREDSLFDALNEENITFNDIKVDVNPITPEKSGTIEQYLAHLEELYAKDEEQAIENLDEKLKKKEIDNLIENNNAKPDSISERKEKVLPFSIINNELKGRVNIKFDTVENNPEFQNILKELKSNGWKFAPSTKQWYPVGNAVNSAIDFANKLQEKYSVSLNKAMEPAMDIGAKKSPYDGIKFFDRNYNECVEFTEYFNKNLDAMGKNRMLTLDEAKIILRALNHDNNLFLKEKTDRLGLDSNGNLIVLTKVKSDVKTQSVTLSELLELAKDKARETLDDSKAMLERFYKTQNQKEFIEVMGNLFQSAVDKNEEILNGMQDICNEYIITTSKELEKNKSILYQRNSYRGWEISADKDFKKSYYVRPFEQSDRSGYILMAGKEGKDGFWQEKFVREMLKSNNWTERTALVETLTTIASDTETCKTLGIESPTSLNEFFLSLDKIIKTENDSDIKEELMNSLLGVKETQKLSKEAVYKEKIPELKVGDKIGESYCSDVYKIADGIYQATLEMPLDNGAVAAQSYFVLDKNIHNELSDGLKDEVKSFGDKSVIENKNMEPYVIKELIEKNLMPPRDSEYVEKLNEYTSAHPLKYEKLKPVDFLNFEDKLRKLAELDKEFNKTSLELGQQLISLVDDSDKEGLNKWLVKQGCTSQENMAKVFASWISGNEQKIENTKKKDSGYPPRGED